MKALGLVGLFAAQLVLGYGILGLMRPRVRACLMRTEELGLAMLVGCGVQALLVLFGMMAGYRLHGAWYFALGLLGVALVALRRDRVRRSEPRLMFSLGYLITGAGVFLLVFWAVLAAYGLPTTDYDTLAIWNPRQQVLLDQRTIYTPDLRDAARWIVQPLHPYLFSVIETAPLVALGGFSETGVHFAELWIYLGYLAVGAGAVRYLRSQERRMAACAALLLLPVMATGWLAVSPREPVIATFAFVSIYFLARWSDEARREWLGMSALFALLAQQTKIEGLAFAAGWGVAVATLVVLSRESSRLKQVGLTAGAMVMLALPWAIVKKGIPPAHIDGFMADYSAIMRIPMRHIPVVVGLLFSEMLARPELYGLTGWITFVALARGWRGTAWPSRAAILAAPLLYLGAIVAIYAARQAELPFEANISITRRIIVIMPALAFAALWRPNSNNKLIN